jgi:hypothetical protein
LAELSGLAVAGGAVWAMADGGRRVALHQLDLSTCAVIGDWTVAIDPYDAEDLATGPDGTLWVGDTGDNELRRATIAVIVVPRSGEPALHRLTYPDGPHDAEALLVGADGVPTVITKEIGRARVYRPEATLDGVGPTPLVHVADLDLPASTTPGGPIGGLGSRTVTGGAMSADGRVVALRTYTDAWLFSVPNVPVPNVPVPNVPVPNVPLPNVPVPNVPVPGVSGPKGGDVVAALRGRPVQLPLPGEPQGEALAFTADGTLLSGSETRGGVPGELRAVPGAAMLAVSATDAGPGGAGDPTTAPAADGPGAPAADGSADDTVADGVWRASAIGAGALVVVLGLLAAAMARHAARRR